MSPRSKPTPTDLKDIITVEQAAVRLGVSPATVWRFRRQGLLTSHRILSRTVFVRSEVERLANARTVERRAS